jgi:hypothetical protein
MDYSNSTEINSFSASPGIPTILWNPPLKDLAVCPYPGQINHIQTLTSRFWKISFNIILPSTPRFSKWSLVLSRPQPCYPVFIPPIPATCTAPLILPNVIIRKVMSEEYIL